MLYRVPLAWVRFELTTLVVIGTDCIGSNKSNYHTITATTAPGIYIQRFPRGEHVYDPTIYLTEIMQIGSQQILGSKHKNLNSRITLFD